MENRWYSEQHIRDWCLKHFPPVDASSTNIVLEGLLKEVLIEGSTYFDRYPTAANRTLYRLKTKNKYVRYFTNKAKVENLGFDNFHYLCKNGGSKYTNEFQYTTLLQDLVNYDVIGKSMRLLHHYGITLQ